MSPQCCIGGGGPAGIMLGYLLARAGIRVCVLEKHADFFRDFRGDTIHPSTLELLHQLGILEDFLKIPHQEVTRLSMQIEDTVIPVTDFSLLPTRCKFIALMPQWDFLRFLSERAKQFPTFDLRMEHEVTSVIMEDGKAVGVRVKSPEGESEIHAPLVIAADGRHSTIRKSAGLEVQDYGAPIDVLWFRIPKDPSEPQHTLGYLLPGRLLILINRGDYWQAGYVIPKGRFDEVRAAGLPLFHNQLRKLAPFLGNSVETIQDWDSVKLLSVKIDMLKEWALPGLLCIGDSAHAMSPAGGVGVNLAIQDAVATANIVGPRILNGKVRLYDLQCVQYRREFATRVIQRVQQFIHDKTFGPESIDKPFRGTGLLAALAHAGFSTPMATRFVGLGPRPERIKLPAAKPRLLLTDS